MLSGTALNSTLNKYNLRAFIKLIERVEFNFNDDCSIENKHLEKFKTFNF